MNELLIHAGDTFVVNGVRVRADRKVKLSCEQPLRRVACPGLHDLPETELRISALWQRGGRRVPMVTRQDLRCPCGSAYVRQSATHHSCQYCGRVWENGQVEQGE
jgi:hypothetical protein